MAIQIINVKRDGTIQFVYDDRLRGLLAQGEAKVTRASSVEPDEQNQWWADLAAVRGPKLGPFADRQAALDAEVRWLNEHVLTGAAA
jgi:hypothetical protein